MCDKCDKSEEWIDVPVEPDSPLVTYRKKDEKRLKER
jgi:hypothetical protein